MQYSARLDAAAALPRKVGPAAALQPLENALEGGGCIFDRVVGVLLQQAQEQLSRAKGIDSRVVPKSPHWDQGQAGLPSECCKHNPG